ncbi:MAG TPA: hypothetical protein VFE01_03855 [Terracidiphilus sp.]|jgi:hypothetical protein|nr:hypothetical protein [Terracidiphilus sp.]
MQGTNHWFVAYDHQGELRVSVWNARSRLRAGARHLCGHTCLHKLVDDFMARILAVRSPSADLDSKGAPVKQERIIRRAGSRADNLDPPRQLAMGNPIAPNVDEIESSARLIVPAGLVSSSVATTQSVRLFEVAAAQPFTPVATAPITDAPNYSSRTWRAEAWKREREREEHAAHHASPSTRRRSNA